MATCVGAAGAAGLDKRGGGVGAALVGGSGAGLLGGSGAGFVGATGGVIRVVEW